jgi:DNA-binding NarL/FixJ family response regulator
MCVIRVLLVDDDALVADGFRALLEKEPDIEVVGIAGDGAAALGLVQQHNPDVIVMDVRMPILDGVKTTRQLRARNPQCNILLLTAYNDDEYVRDGIQAGAHGYLLKRAARTELLESIREVARGGAVGIVMYFRPCSKRFRKGQEGRKRHQFPCSRPVSAGCSVS